LRFTPLVLAAIMLAAAACSAAGTVAMSSPSPTPVVSSEPAPGPGAATPEEAVSALAFNRPAQLCEGAEPASRYSVDAGCPVTLRLQNRLRALASGYDPVCRCQSHVATPFVTPLSATRVNAVFKVSFGSAARPNDVYFAVIKLGKSWFVDDTNCSDPSTSIYSDPLQPCR
jgi:hypothetical protein